MNSNCDSAKDKNLWLVLMVKDKYAKNIERQRIKEQIRDLLHLPDDEVFYTPFEASNPYSYYVFVREHDHFSDLHSIFLTPIKDCLTGFRNNQSRITGEEFRKIVKQCKVAPNKEIRFGDFVRIKRGTYSNLYGIVIRQSTRKNKVYVGLKFCFGVVVNEYYTGDLEAIGNLFNYIKVLH